MDPITNYNTLYAAVSDFLENSGHTKALPQIPLFIDLAQLQMERDWKQSGDEKSVTLTITSGSATAPADYTEVIDMTAYDGSSAWTVTRSDPTGIKKHQIVGGTGPQAFDTVGSTFNFGPEPSSGVSVDLTYYAKAARISSSVATNEYTDKAPDLLFFAVMLEAVTFLQDRELMELYGTRYKIGLERLLIEERKRRYSGKLSVRSV